MPTEKAIFTFTKSKVKAPSGLSRAACALNMISSDPNKLHADILEFKVGRSYTPIKRVGQWENSCRSQRHIVRYIFPAPEDQIMLTGMMRQGDPAKFCHRLERLIHLELADLSLNAPYLEMRDKDHVHKLATQPRTRCIDCEFPFGLTSCCLQ